MHTAAPSHSEPPDVLVTHSVPTRRQRNVDHDVIEIPDSPVMLSHRRTHTVPSPVSIDLSDFENFEEEAASHDSAADIDPAVVREMEHNSDLEWEQDFNEPDFELEREFESEAVYEQEPDFELERDFKNESVCEQQEPDIDEKANSEGELDPDTVKNLEVNSDRERNVIFHSSSKEGTADQGDRCKVSHGGHQREPVHLYPPFLSLLPTIFFPSPPLHAGNSKHGGSDLKTGLSKSHAVSSVGKGPALLALEDLQSSNIWDTCSVVRVKVLLVYW